MLRFEIEDLFSQTDKAFICLCIFAPDDKKKDLEVHVVQLRERLVVLKKIDEALAELFQFNKELVTFDATLTELNTWITGRAQVRHSLSLNVEKCNKIIFSLGEASRYKTTRPC